MGRSVSLGKFQLASSMHGIVILMILRTERQAVFDTRRTLDMIKHRDRDRDEVTVTLHASHRFHVDTRHNSLHVITYAKSDSVPMYVLDPLSRITKSAVPIVPRTVFHA